jgi:hypothetical protein
MKSVIGAGFISQYSDCWRRIHWPERIGKVGERELKIPGA